MGARVDIVALLQGPRRNFRLDDLALLRRSAEVVVTSECNDAVKLLRGKPSLDGQRTRDSEERLRVEVQIEVEVW